MWLVTEVACLLWQPISAGDHLWSNWLGGEDLVHFIHDGVRQLRQKL